MTDLHVYPLEQHAFDLLNQASSLVHSALISPSWNQEAGEERHLMQAGHLLDVLKLHLTLRDMRRADTWFAAVWRRARGEDTLPLWDHLEKNDG